MPRIIIGTTPSIKYTFSVVDVTDIATAILTIKKNNGVVVRKELADAEVGENSLSWHLRQAETLAIGTGGARMMLNWVTTDGTRGASKEVDIETAGNHIPEVI